MSDVSAMLRRVDRIDGWRLFRRMIPRRWKRLAGIAVLVGMVVRPDLAAQAVSWVWEDRAQRLVSIMSESFTPENPPQQSANPGIFEVISRAGPTDQISLAGTWVEAPD